MSHSFTPMQRNAGFDNDTSLSSSWQMVPLGDQRKLMLNGVSNKTIVACDQDWIARVTTNKAGNGLLLTLRGIKEGVTSVEFLPPPNSNKNPPNNFSLDVSVKKRKEVKITFFYVSDKHGNGTARRKQDLKDLIARANNILTPQANVVIVSKRADSLVVDVDLGDVVRKVNKSSPTPQSEDEFRGLKKHRDGGADVTLFFVHEWEKDETPSVDDVAASAYWRKGSYLKKKMIMFQDRMQDDGVTLAHEVIHTLGIHSHVDKKNNLNAKGSERTGTFIPKKHVDIINPDFGK